MSRLAQAYRKVAAAGGRVDFALAAGDSWITTKVPWDLGHGDAVSDVCAIDAAPGFDASASSPDVDPRVSSDDQAALAHSAELLPLVQRFLQAHASQRPVRSLAFAAVDQERSGEVCAGTAEALACHIAGSVCVVDANFRCPSLDVLFGARGTVGLSDALRGEHSLRACISKLRRNLWLLPAGSRTSQAAPLLAGETARRTLTQLIDTFDYVLVDTAPVSRYSDAISIGSAVDGVVLVVTANATRREVAKNAAQHLADGNAHIFGAVLTDRTFPIPEAVYRKL
jgi:Mrp family chromosome partitioning ATPase